MEDTQLHIIEQPLSGYPDAEDPASSLLRAPAAAAEEPSGAGSEELIKPDQVNGVLVLSLLDKIIGAVDQIQLTQAQLEERQAEMEGAVQSIQGELSKLGKAHAATSSTVGKLLEKVRKVSVNVKTVRGSLERQAGQIKKLEVNEAELLRRRNFKVMIYQPKKKLSAPSDLVTPKIVPFDLLPETEPFDLKPDTVPELPPFDQTPRALPYYPAPEPLPTPKEPTAGRSEAAGQAEHQQVAEGGGDPAGEGGRRAGRAARGGRGHRAVLGRGGGGGGGHRGVARGAHPAQRHAARGRLQEGLLQGEDGEDQGAHPREPGEDPPQDQGEPGEDAPHAGEAHEQAGHAPGARRAPREAQDVSREAAQVLHPGPRGLRALQDGRVQGAALHLPRQEDPRGRGGGAAGHRDGGGGRRRRRGPRRRAGRGPRPAARQQPRRARAAGDHRGVGRRAGGQERQRLRLGACLGLLRGGGAAPPHLFLPPPPFPPPNPDVFFSRTFFLFRILSPAPATGLTYV
ncbi:caveolae-associated protein 1 isoform X1 [Pipistrellus kuhlii]|uniref:caveolae-associated protein 1 isoform X1 n=1 Tax=Pipistrellus kuhlii TaxID=59472 RepID=UPI001E26F857|nr:caveolae-associated protein 1 isoform X1 [Pipistrellus kuhlii]